MSIRGKSSSYFGVALLLGASGAVAAPPAPPPITPAASTEDPGLTVIVAQKKSTQETRAKEQLAKLKAAPPGATDDAYQKAAKKVGLDLAGMSAEYKSLALEKDAATRETKGKALTDKYAPLLLKLYSLAGVDVGAEQKKAVALMTQPNATASPLVHHVVFTGVLDEPAVSLPAPPGPTPPPPQAISVNLGPRFAVRHSTSRDFNSAQATNGYMDSGFGAHFLGAGIEVSGLGNRFTVPAGYRHVEIVAELDDVRWQLYGDAFGHIYGEVRIVMSLNDGTTLECEDDRPLGLFEASGVVGVSEFRHVGHLRFTCSHTWPAGAPARTLTASVSMWATASSVGAPADMFADVDGRITAMHATISP